MLAKGADPNGPSSLHPAGWTALHVAATNCHAGVVRLLLEHGALTTIRSTATFGSMPAGSTAQDALLGEKARVMLNPDPRSARRTEELIDRFDATIAAFIVLPPEPTFNRPRGSKAKRKAKRRRSLVSWFK